MSLPLTSIYSTSSRTLSLIVRVHMSLPFTNQWSLFPNLAPLTRPPATARGTHRSPEPSSRCSCCESGGIPHKGHGFNGHFDVENSPFQDELT